MRRKTKYAIELEGDGVTLGEADKEPLGGI